MGETMGKMVQGSGYVGPTVGYNDDDDDYYNYYYYDFPIARQGPWLGPSS